MGTDYDCGCRTSGGAYYLCDKHEALFVLLMGECDCLDCEEAREFLESHSKLLREGGLCRGE